MLKPVIPDPGVEFQLVHHDDVAAAFRAAILGRGTPGVYNLAGPGILTMSGLADALGWYSVPLPDFALDATAEVVARLPFVPAEAQWVETFRVPVLMDTTQGPARAALAPEARGVRDAQGDGPERTVRAADPLARPSTAARPWFCTQIICVQ